jgi:hypothetical protein
VLKTQNQLKKYSFAAMGNSDIQNVSCNPDEN